MIWQNIINLGGVEMTKKREGISNEVEVVETEESIRNMRALRLNFQVKQYVGITKLITATKQRLGSVPGEAQNGDYDEFLKGVSHVPGLETLKGRVTRAIEKELVHFPVWTAWAQNVPGIGSYIAGQMILLFNYRFISICKKCGGDLEKGEKDGRKTLLCEKCKTSAYSEGVLQYRVEEKDFPTISKWWAYLGMHTVPVKDTDQRMKPRRKAGELSNWSTVGRTLCYHIGEEFNRQQADNQYKALLLEHKAKHARNHQEKPWTVGHIHNASKNEVAKIFLAHWWTIQRVLDGKTISKPYAGAIMGHTNIVNPPFLSGDLKVLVETELRELKAA
jgi:hypothetical protein